MSHLGRSTSRGHTFSATPSRDSSRPSSAQSTHSNQSTYSGLSGLSNHQLPQQVDALIQAAASSNTDKKVEAIEALVDALKKQQITLEPTTLDPLLPPLLRLLHLPAPKLHLPSLHLLSRLSRLLSRTPRLPHSTLRTLLNDSLPLCLERLSDPRDKVREAAVDAAVELFGVVAGVAKEAERSAAVGGVGHQRAQEILGWVEKTVKADGLGSKSWRVREQTLLLLHHSLRMLPTFPTFGMRPYIPAVVRLLEDQQDPVRARAREVLVEAYNWDTTPATLRGEIHRELRKQPPRQSTSELLSAAFDETLEVAVPISNVSSPPQPQQAQPSALPLPRTRQGSGSVVSSVGSALSSPVDPDGGAGLMRGKTPSSGSLGGSKAVSGVPVRIAGSTRSSGGRETAETELAAGGGASPVGLDIKIEEDVKFHSPRDLDTFLMSFQSTFRGKETEQNWDERERMLKRVTTMCVRGYVGWDGFTGNGGREGGKGDTGAKIVCEGMGRTMLSLRTSLCLQTLSTITALSSTLPTCLDAYLESYLIPNLLKLGSGSKRITATAARQCLAHVLPRASLNPRHVQLLGDKYAEEKSAQGRAAIIGAVGCVVKGCVGISTRKEHFERGGGLGVVEMVLKKGVGDGNKEVREAAREVWSVVEKAWPGVADNWLNAMDATTRKAVMRGFGSALPVPATSGIRPPIRSKPSFTRPASASSTMSTEELPASSPSPKSERLSPLYPTTPAVVRTTVSDADVRRVPSPTSMVSERTSLSSGSRASSAPRSTPADRLAVLRSASSTPLLRRSAASALLLDLDSGAVELGMLLAALSEAYEVDPTLADDVLERLVTRTGDDAVLDELCHLLKPLEDVVRTPPRRMPESTSSRLVRMPANTTAVLYWLDARLEVASWWLAVRAHLHSLVLLVGPLVGEVEDALAAAMCARLLRRCAAEDTEEFWKVLESLEPDVAERAEVIVGGRDGSGVMSEADDDEHVDEDTMEAIEIMPTDFPVGRNDRNSIATTTMGHQPQRFPHVRMIKRSSKETLS
ncbi:hypothetical protein M427DRAFT_182257 [Gonapodya prolifera JEL478]|uniref:TOG domain-containing protein n=1 Tax=Gonapodya prolifera (strain JEL478) TaxID=1344416 RepID=A0A139A0R5_GONPJ|nr:hypothetical protein M427DRAFT_182257 [Gonapodya prolifera JEL478]|eukprot:KXS10314.1 hypothetical protein M427DRAFT_182257 [Gonapodya prolifera JEL478]